MGKYRKRFNEKARAGTVKRQDTLRRARQKQFHRDEEDNNQDANDSVNETKEVDPNSEILLPMTSEEKAERKRKLEESLIPVKENKISRNKRKRLDKYIVSSNI